MAEPTKNLGVVTPVKFYINRDKAKGLCSFNEVKAMLKNYGYIVTGSFIKDVDKQNHPTSAVLYKGDDKQEACRIWENYFGFKGANLFMQGLRLNGLCKNSNWSGGYEPGYLFGLFDPDRTLGNITKISKLKESRKHDWYVVRICDLSPSITKLAGQIIYEGDSREEAERVWIGNKLYYIFTTAIYTSIEDLRSK